MAKPRGFTTIDGALSGVAASIAFVAAVTFILSCAWVKDARHEQARDHERLEVCVAGWEVCHELAGLSADVARGCMAQLDRFDAACSCWVPEGGAR